MCVLCHQMICAPPRGLPRASLRSVLPYTALCSHTKQLQMAILLQHMAKCCGTQHCASAHSTHRLEYAALHRIKFLHVLLHRAE